MKRFSIILLSLTMALGLQAQDIDHVDPLACPIIGFSISRLTPSQHLSRATAVDGSATMGTMSDLYKPPYLGFGMDFSYKLENNLIFSLEWNIIMGSNNLTDRVGRMPNVFTRDSLIVGTNGTDANVTCYNRGLNVKGGIGYIFKLNDNNPNSGILTKLSAGWMSDKTVFMINDVNAPQVDKPYDKLYDHRRSGFVLTESVGYMFMSNHKTLVNMYVAFEVSQFWNHSTRNYTIDNLMGLSGKDQNRYFDLLYSIKFCWMFPLTGKPAYDFYY